MDIHLDWGDLAAFCWGFFCFTAVHPRWMGWLACMGGLGMFMLGAHSQ